MLYQNGFVLHGLCSFNGLPRIIKSLAVLSKNARLTTDCCYWITFAMRSNPLAEPQGLPDISYLLWEYVQQGTKTDAMVLREGGFK